MDGKTLLITDNISNSCVNYVHFDTCLCSGNIIHVVEVLYIYIPQTFFFNELIPQQGSANDSQRIGSASIRMHPFGLSYIILTRL